MPNIIVKCQECNALIAGATQAQANRNLGLHRRSKHGYQSPKYSASKQYRANAKARAQGGAAVATTIGPPVKRYKLSPARLAQLDAAREARWGKGTVTDEERRTKQRESKAHYREKQRVLKYGSPEPRRTGRPPIASKYTPEQIAQRRAYQVSYRERMRQQKNEYSKNWYRKKKAGANSGLTTSEAVPCNLASCPVCGSKFFVVKGAL